MTSLPAKPPVRSDKRRRRIVLGSVILVTLGILGGGLVLLEDRADDRFAVVQATMDDQHLPAEAVERADARASYGRGLAAYMCLDTNCPYVKRQWFVPVSADDEASFTDTVVDQQRFDLLLSNQRGCNADAGTCYAIGTDGTTEILVSLDAVPESVTPPSHDVSPKQWRLLTITVQLR